MDIIINIVEAVNELADLAVRREICNNEAIEEGDGEWEKVYCESKDEPDTTVYTDEAQEEFMIQYDYYFDMLLNMSIDHKLD